jgi:hypothetical protein
MAYLEVVDVTLAESEDGQPRVNVGDTQSGVGTGAGIPVWGSGDGFVGIPNAPSSSGSAQAVVFVEGNQQRVIAIRDYRTIGQAGALAEGDRAIVSDSQAWLLLTKSTDKIELRSLGASGTLKVEVDGDNDRVRLTVGFTTLTLSSAGLALDGPGAAILVNGVAMTVP